MNRNIKKINKSIIWFSFGLLFLFGIGLAYSVKAEEGSLSIFPQIGTFTVENTFDVSVFVNTGGNDINVVRVDLKFDPKKLQVVTPARGISVIGEWVFPPSFSNKEGTISLQGGFTDKGINTSEGLISVIVFRAIASGETTVNFLDSSKVLLGDEKGTNILSSVNRATYNIILSPSKGPKIYSETHPDQNKWYKNSSPSFFWDKVGESQGYSYEINDDPFGEPNNVIDTQSTSISFEEIEEGVQYFHLKTKKADVWGGTSHFKIMIDKTPPVRFRPYLELLSFTADNNLLIHFNTHDLLSGVKNYQVRVADYTDPKNVVLAGWIREESPFRLSTEKKGTYQLSIRVFDEAGNFNEEKIQVRIFSPNLIIIGGGIQIKGLFFPGWLIYLFLAIILFAVGYLIFRKIKGKLGLARVDLGKEIREAEKEIEDVRRAKEKLSRIRALEEKGKGEWQRLKSALQRIVSPLGGKKEDKKDE